MSATSGPRTRMCAHSPIANTIATPARRLVAASSEWMSVAGSTASRLTAKSALGAAKACDDAHRWDLRDEDEGRVDEKDDPDRVGAERSVGLCKWWQDVGEERVADDDEHDIGCDHSEEETISSDGAIAGSVGVCCCDGLGSRAWYGKEHDQRESGVGDGVEEIERLERTEPLCESDDEAGYGRAD